MDPIFDWARRHQQEVIEVIRDYVRCESPSDSPEMVRDFLNLILATTTDIAEGRLVGNSLVLNFNCPGQGKKGQILALGHGDTVWPAGTINKMQCRESEGR